MMNKQYVYMFSEGNATMRNTLGGKGANLSEMTHLGLPVPQGFVVSTDACVRYYDESMIIDDEIVREIERKLNELEIVSGKKFGDNSNPLLVSVRSGARVSMPGMMDTILNLGMNDTVAASLYKVMGITAYDSYRRLIQMFSEVAMGVDKKHFDTDMQTVLKKYDIESDHDLTLEALKDVIERYKDTYIREVGKPFPDDPKEQLLLAIESVFKSWNTPRAKYYRKLNGFSDKWGTAVTIQEMVFGNMGQGSATGVAFSRNPATGEDSLYGEFLYNAQGEDVVAGTHTPLPMSDMKITMPEIYQKFYDYAKQLEKHYHDMQDMEFTVERGNLYLLQTRSGKRTAQAAVKIAIDLVNEGVMTKEEAVNAIDVNIIDALLHPQFDRKVLKEVQSIAKGLPASPGAATGVIAFTAAQAVHYYNKGKSVILTRHETSPEDIEGMHVSSGILTARGGMTSHAAVVARGMGKSCVVGCSDIVFHKFDEATINGKVYKEGDEISIDGGTGLVYDGKLKTQEVSISEDFETILKWSDEFSKLKVYTNADTPEDVQKALDFGAKGIGLVRTEHMFFESDRIRAVREMILSQSQTQREIALKKILPMQRKDFEDIFRLMKDLPVTIRYLDPPLHEFMPTATQDIEELAKVMNITTTDLREVIRSLHEYNPMMGHRGCRLAISYPEIALMQTQALIEAAINITKETGYTLQPEIMIPLVGDVSEFNYLATRIRELSDKLIKDANVDVNYRVGTMIELPRACILADEIAVEADFLSFGTNDLTQMTYGFSRDDAGGFLNDYLDKHIYTSDPFSSLDTQGVSQLIDIAIEKARSVKPNIKIGICGEHGGDPKSIAYFKQAGFDYVSCSPYRVPIARIALGQK
ncbi:MAG: pyruvate, phosphate dikinase [Erysipelothrix sp.]|nr:pyruvate, phosphate dikinase [Erysipelothrix sp.]